MSSFQDGNQRSREGTNDQQGLGERIQGLQGQSHRGQERVQETGDRGPGNPVPWVLLTTTTFQHHQ